MPRENIIIRIQGLVQGVGFRPFIYRLAKEIKIKGEIKNQTGGVFIRAFLTQKECESFIECIRKEHPAVASIHSITIEKPEDTIEYTTFSIAKSRSVSDNITQVAPDIAVCTDCMNDRKQQKHRLRYPFINCTHCGPRFSIIRDLPYDREQTTMHSFSMCPDCRKEYTDISDRRFHAQPVACNHCGPHYYALYNNIMYTEYASLLAITAKLIQDEEVIAAKGVGGYHLICNALSEKAVSRLRKIKQRDNKPFAVMFRDMQSIRQYAHINKEEEACLTSWRRPIVLVKQRKTLASGVNPGMNTIGCMLPYMPLHYDWFDSLQTPALVMTSGNLSDLPIAVTPEEAEEQLKGKIPLILHHNRAIHNRVDDSVLQIIGNQPCLIRRSRGYAPEPFFINKRVEGILAFGAEKTNTFALGKGETIIQSQHIGDLKNWETLRFYTESIEHYQQLFRFTPRLLVCDLHPDYLSSREAEKAASPHQLPLIKVQHHHAHAVACMVEYNIDEEVIAIIMDGTGLGHDGNSWGGEFFLCNRKTCKRLAHLEYVPLPGGDKASLEPWRMAVAYLHTYNLDYPAGFKERVGEDKINRIRQMIDKRINTPLTSGAGRLFDAVASLLGICDMAKQQAEAPILLEQHATFCPTYMEEPPYPYCIDDNNNTSVRHVLEEIIRDLANGTETTQIAARFHITFAHLLMDKAKQLIEQTGTTKVVISGGCFQNKFLTEQLQHLFAGQNIPLYIPSLIPCNDEGIAVGQLLIAANNIPL